MQRICHGGRKKKITISTYVVPPSRTNRKRKKKKKKKKKNAAPWPTPVKNATNRLRLPLRLDQYLAELASQIVMMMVMVVVVMVLVMIPPPAGLPPRRRRRIKVPSQCPVVLAQPRPASNQCSLLGKRIPSLLPLLFNRLLTEMPKSVAPSIARLDQRSRVDKSSRYGLHHLEDLHRIVHTADLALARLEDCQGNAEQRLGALTTAG